MLLGSFVPIFYCEHDLFVYIKKQKQNFFLDFQNFSKIEFCQRQILENSITHKPFLVSREVPKKNQAGSVQPFRRLMDTNRQKTRGQAKYKYRFGFQVASYSLYLITILFFNNSTYSQLLLSRVKRDHFNHSQILPDFSI